MIQTKVSATTVARSLSDFINRAAYRDEHFVLTRGNKPVAELRPLLQARHLGELAGIIESLPHLDKEDFENSIESLDLP